MHYNAVHPNRQPITEPPADFANSTSRDNYASRVVPGQLLVEDGLT
jgi:hypothetical protein